MIQVPDQQMSSGELVIRRVHALDDAELLSLIAKSDAYLSALYPPESNHAEPLDALIGNDSAFFTAYLDDELVACGAVKFAENDVRYGEIKRVFVDERQRGKRLATRLMQHLEHYVTIHGVYVLRLEAGPKQPQALKLYRGLGYVERPPFGAYRPDPLSVFMEKVLQD